MPICIRLRSTNSPRNVAQPINNVAQRMWGRRSLTPLLFDNRGKLIIGVQPKLCCSEPIICSLINLNIPLWFPVQILILVKPNEHMHLISWGEVNDSISDIMKWFERLGPKPMEIMTAKDFQYFLSTIDLLPDLRIRSRLFILADSGLAQFVRPPL